MTECGGVIARREFTPDEAIPPIDSDDLIFYDDLMGEKIYFVYIMTNLHNTTLYTGITNNLLRRVQEHKQGKGGQFSGRYKMKKLVFFEIHSDVRAAIAREKQIKGGSRMDKLKYITTINPEWLDLLLEIE